MADDFLPNDERTPGDDLSPDRVLSRLTTSWLGKTYLYEREVPSTNDWADRLAREGGAHGTVVAADAQSRGKGRLGRRWHSPRGVNLYFSVLLRPAWEVARVQPISLAVGVALAEALESFLPAAPELKWPNDLLWQGKKLAGILVESTLAGKQVQQEQQVQHVIVGLGLNVNQEEFPEELAGRAISMKMMTGRTLDRGEVLAGLLGRLEHWIDRMDRHGLPPVVDTWQRYAPWIGREITVQHGNKPLSGTALGLTPLGALRLRDAAGCEAYGRLGRCVDR